MEFFDRHKALIITILSMSILLLLLFNISLSSSRRELGGTLIDLQNLQYEEPVQQEEQSEPEPPQQESPSREQSSVRTHQAFNQNQEENQRNFESRLEEIFQKNSAKSSESNAEQDTEAEGEFSLNSNEERTREQSDGNDASDEISRQTGSMRNSSIAFSLLGRAAVRIPNPIYTCDTSGKIVITIIVNAEGLVTETSFNSASSTSTNECLINQAREYASDAVFSRLPGRDSQIGTITYNFQG